MTSAIRTRAALALLVWLAGTAGVAGADTLRIVPLVRDGQVLVTCQLVDGYTSDVRDVIQSGLKTTFTYTVELRLRVPMWVDRVVDSTVVTTTVQFDSLTRRHLISRSLDGRADEAKVTEDEGEVREWLTAFDKLPLFKTSRLEPNRDYYVVVRAAARPSSNVPLWPWGSSVSGMTKFTFIP
ncbi:MAG: DUF4390 domain-containing protein [Vicinamibacterales bacterium]